MFKIRNKEGLFSTGGCNPSFSKGGKAWRTLGHINSHLTNVCDLNVYKNCELVEIVQIVGTEKKLSEYISECQSRKVSKEKSRQESQERFAKARRKEEYEKLKKEFA